MRMAVMVMLILVLSTGKFIAVAATLLAPWTAFKLERLSSHMCPANIGGRLRFQTNSRKSFGEPAVAASMLSRCGSASAPVFGVGLVRNGFVPAPRSSTKALG